MSSQKINTYTDPHANLIYELKESVDHSAFETLYDAYSGVLFGIIMRIVADQKEAENLLQDCFIKIWKNIKLYDPEKGKVATWLINIARHTAIDFIRTPYYKQKLNRQEVGETDNSAKQLLAQPQTIETLDVKQLVAKLSPECREVLERMYFDGYTQQEISDIFGIPLGTVKTRSRSALKELRTYYNYI